MFMISGFKRKYPSKKISKKNEIYVTVVGHFYVLVSVVAHVRTFGKGGFFMVQPDIRIPKSRMQGRPDVPVC